MSLLTNCIYIVVLIVLLYVLYTYKSNIYSKLIDIKHHIIKQTHPQNEQPYTDQSDILSNQYIDDSKMMPAGINDDDISVENLSFL
jgi:hypothetical protein